MYGQIGLLCLSLFLAIPGIAFCSEFTICQKEDFRFGFSSIDAKSGSIVIASMWLKEEDKKFSLGLVREISSNGDQIIDLPVNTDGRLDDNSARTEIYYISSLQHAILVVSPFRNAMGYTISARCKNIPIEK